MDKTGTITKGNFVVQTILPAGTASEQEILQIAAACETASTHPIGISIVSAAKDQKLVIEKPAEIEEISGQRPPCKALPGRSALRKQKASHRV